MRAYRKLRGLVVPALRRVVRIAAQSEADARRFVRLGAVHEQVEASGNLKLDAQLSRRVEDYITSAYLKSSESAKEVAETVDACIESQERRATLKKLVARSSKPD